MGQIILHPIRQKIWQIFEKVDIFVSIFCLQYINLYKQNLKQVKKVKQIFNIHPKSLHIKYLMQDWHKFIKANKKFQKTFLSFFWKIMMDFNQNIYIVSFLPLPYSVIMKLEQLMFGRTIFFLSLLIYLSQTLMSLQPTREIAYTNFTVSLGDFGYDWSFYQYTVPMQNPFIQYHRQTNGSLIHNSHSILPAVTKLYGILDPSNEPNFIAYSNTTFVLMSQNLANAAILPAITTDLTLGAPMYPYFAVISNSSSNIIQKVHLPNRQLNSSYDLLHLPLLLEADPNAIFAYTSTYNITCFDQNLTPLLSFVSNKGIQNSVTQLSLHYDNITQYIVRTTSQFVIVHSTANGSQICYITVSQASQSYPIASTQFNEALICQNILIIMLDQEILFYDLPSLELGLAVQVEVSLPMTSKTKKLKCFPSQSEFGYMVQNAVNATQNFIVYYNLSSITLVPINNNNNGTNNTNETNQTSSVNQTNPINQTSNQTNTTNFNNQTNSQNSQNSSNLSNNTVNQINLNRTNESTESIYIFNFPDQVIKFLQQQSIKNFTQKSVSVAGVAAASPFGRAFVRPIINLLQDFWFYKFHAIEYPKFVEYFTSQVDILNDLRIKPSFLNFQINIQKYQYENQKYTNISILQKRAPQSVLMLQAVSDIYIINIPMAIGQFFLIIFLRALISELKNFHFIFRMIYKQLAIYCFVWMLFIASLEQNVAPITFFGSVQFNVFISFDWVSKLNLIFTILIVFTTFTYTFIIYPMVLKYQKTKYSKKMFDISKFGPDCFWLEMVLKCFRNFFQGLIHGCLINNHFGQLLSLIGLDIVLIGLIIKMRGMFCHRINLILSIIYLLLFLAFDTCLWVYSFINFSNNQVSSIYIFNNILAVIILSLFGVTFLQLLFNLGLFVYETVKMLKHLVQKLQISQDIQQQKVQHTRSTGKNSVHIQSRHFITYYRKPNKTISPFQSKQRNSRSIYPQEFEQSFNETKSTLWHKNNKMILNFYFNKVNEIQNVNEQTLRRRNNYKVTIKTKSARTAKNILHEFKA